MPMILESESQQHNLLKVIRPVVRSAKLHFTTQYLWKNAPCTDKTKVDVCGYNRVPHNTTPEIIKHSGGEVMICTGFAATGPGHLIVTETTVTLFTLNLKP